MKTVMRLCSTQAQMYKLFTCHHIQNTVRILLQFVKKDINCSHSPKNDLSTLICA